MILIDSKGPIFYRQKRSGINNTIFWCWKFRSMSSSNNSEFIQATQNDSRITAIGSFLRKTNLDELPQFFNVFMGDMSLVGPRPHPVELDTEYVSSISKYRRRLSVKPGITGLAQVRGYRGETHESYMMKNRVKMDIFYFENWSILFDIKIALLTIMTTFKGDSKAY
jgi:putative colanic acid biosynthesis UDP-glucose lipid carrier transferase